MTSNIGDSKYIINNLDLIMSLDNMKELKEELIMLHNKIRENPQLIIPSLEYRLENIQ